MIEAEGHGSDIWKQGRVIQIQELRPNRGNLSRTIERGSLPQDGLCVCV